MMGFRYGDALDSVMQNVPIISIEILIAGRFNSYQNNFNGT